MMRSIPESHPLHRLFRGLTETTFLSELGIGDPKLVGYVADLLARFVPSDAIWAIRDGEGRRLTQVSQIVAEAESTPSADRRRDCHRHVGDVTLFWAGLYPEAISTLKHADRTDAFINLQEQGKHSYFIASTLDAEHGPVLRRLSHEFELCAVGLAKVRQEWERFDPPPPSAIGRVIAS